MNESTVTNAEAAETAVTTLITPNGEVVDLQKTTPEHEAWALMQRKAKAFASSDLVPTNYRNKIANVIIAMEVANRIGASVLAVMQHLYIVHGKPAFEATFLIASVNSSARWTPLKFKFQGDQGKPNWGCRAYSTDKSSGEECVGPLVTMAMAKAEGWTEKSGSKWQTMPELMLHYRAAAFWTRIFAPELSMGMHTIDEIQDVYGQQTTIEEPQADQLEQLTTRLKTEQAEQYNEQQATSLDDL